MFDPSRDLLATLLRPLTDGTSDEWAYALGVLRSLEELEPELLELVELEDAEGLGALLAAWDDNSVLRALHDRGVLKRALKAFRKRLKLLKLDDESRIGGAFSSGARSGIVAIEPPDQFPRDVWAELVRQGRLLDAGHRQLELPPE